MTISTIVAMGNNNEIGKGNDIPWYLPADLKYFKKTTLGCPIIMGRKCYESIGRPLPKRTNIIITRNRDYKVDGCLVVHSLEEAVRLAQKEDTAEVFIIGGGQIYKEAMPLIEKLYLTKVDIEIENAEIFFPRLDMAEWRLLSEEAHTKDEKNKYDYTFMAFERK